MRRNWTVMFLVALMGCMTPQGAGGSRFSPSPGARPAVKKELPWLNVPGGRMKTTLFYGPWQCRQAFMNQCQLECASESYKLMGCMWLADIKFDWEGALVAPPIPVKAGSRYGIYHCCCDYPTLSAAENEVARKKWNGFRDSFRVDWSERFGQWPSEADRAWPGHHVRDLKHGGNPVDPNNLIPAEPRSHDEFGRQYPSCYAGQEPWSKAGPDLPYTDN